MKLGVLWRRFGSGVTEKIAWLLSAENRSGWLEGSIFRLTNRNQFVVEARLGPGSEVEQFFTNRR
jgi:hypothetical protein